MAPVFQPVACFILTLHIVGRWKYYVCCTRSDVIPCIHFVVLYLCLMCQHGLHVVLWSHIGILMRLLAAEPHSTAGILFPSQYLSGMILMTMCSMVWTGGFQQQGQCFFNSLATHFLFCLSLTLSLLSFYWLIL